jgi:hypothetical protein
MSLGPQGRSPVRPKHASKPTSRPNQGIVRYLLGRTPLGELVGVTRRHLILLENCRLSSVHVRDDVPFIIRGYQVKLFAPQPWFSPSDLGTSWTVCAGPETENEIESSLVRVSYTSKMFPQLACQLPIHQVPIHRLFKCWEWGYFRRTVPKGAGPQTGHESIIV